MKFTVHKLKIGDLVRAQVVEYLSDKECIVSFHGDLVRVKNESATALVPNDKVLVRVIAIHPLTFQVISAADHSRGATRINIMG